MGHVFAHVHVTWTYQGTSVEMWPNVFSMHALEVAGVEPLGGIAFCDENTVVDFDDWGPMEGLCFLMQFQYRYGWELYEDFFRDLNEHPRNSGVPGGDAAWHFVHDSFEAVTGEDVTPLFDSWNVPHAD
jgi:hypothetical protein